MSKNSNIKKKDIATRMDGKTIHGNNMRMIKRMTPVKGESLMDQLKRLKGE